MTRDNATGCELVEQTLAGDPRKRDALAQMVQERIYPYLRRVTLDEHKAEDLTQDTVLAVLSSLSTLRRTDRFWPWVFTIATNLVREQIRSQVRHRTIPMSTVEEAQLASRSDEQDGLAESARRELAELTHQAMERITERYRMILSLRLYENMPYSEVAETIGCTEFNARALFCRAKHALTRELRKRGVARKAMLPALVAFGTATLHPAAAPAATVAVSSAAVAEGVMTILFTAKTKAAVLVLLLMSAVGTWAFLNGRGAASTSQGPVAPGQPTATASFAATPPTNDAAPMYIHTVCHGRCLGAKAGLTELFELWYYLPEGPNGPRLKQHVPVNETDRGRVSWDIETADMNYHYYAGPQEMHLTNARAYCAEGHTAIIPTDSLEFCAFIQAMDGEMSHALIDKKGFTIQRDPQTGFVVGVTDTRPRVGAEYHSALEYNPPMQADPFAYVPPANMKVVDDRDIMHQRGWTYYRVSGQFNGESITGGGQIPFSYALSRQKPHWLRLRIGERFVISDDGRQAVVQDQAGAIRLTFPGGSFLNGLSRPWAGFHTLDTIRRDAAAGGCPYTLTRGEEPIHVLRLLRDTERSTTAPAGGAEFTVDAEVDLLLNAKYWAQNEHQPECELKFTYLEDVANVGDEFVPPPPAEPSPNTVHPGTTPLWPVELLRLLGLK